MAKGKKSIGAWAFLVGVILALIVGIFSANITGTLYGLIIAALVIIGIVIGFMNITDKEASGFLLAGAVLVIVSTMGSSALKLGDLGIVGGALNGILNALTILFVPTTIIVALKTVFALAKD